MTKVKSIKWRRVSKTYWDLCADYHGAPAIVGSIKHEDDWYKWEARTMDNTRVDGRCPSGGCSDLETAKLRCVQALEDTQTI